MHGQNVQMSRLCRRKPRKPLVPFRSVDVLGEMVMQVVQGSRPSIFDRKLAQCCSPICVVDQQL